MSGEAIVVYGATQKTLESNDAQIPANAVAQASVAGYDVVVDGSSYPDAAFVITCSFAAAPTSNSTISLYAAPQDIDGTLDAYAPEATRPSIFIGTFGVKATTASQTIPMTGVVARDLPANALYFLHNNTSVTLNTGWALKVKAQTYKAAT